MRRMTNGLLHKPWYVDEFKTKRNLPTVVLFSGDKVATSHLFLVFNDAAFVMSEFALVKEVHNESS